MAPGFPRAATDRTISPTALRRVLEKGRCSLQPVKEEPHGAAQLCGAAYRDVSPSLLRAEAGDTKPPTGEQTPALPWGITRCLRSREPAREILTASRRAERPQRRATSPEKGCTAGQ